MRAWSASAISKYYRDPTILFLHAGHQEPALPPEDSVADGAGYYVVPHCDPDCCDAFGGISAVHLGPFSTPEEAREWSCINLGEGEG